MEGWWPIQTMFYAGVLAMFGSLTAELWLIWTWCYMSDMLCSGWGCESATAAKYCVAWGKFRNILPVLTTKRLSPKICSKVCEACVHAAMLHGSETWGPNTPDLQLLHCNDCAIFCINSLRPRQNDRLFVDDIFKSIFLNENVWISIKISLKFVPEGLINNIPALIQIMAWRRLGDKPLSEAMMVNLPTHICVSRPQLINDWLWFTALLAACHGLVVDYNTLYIIHIIPKVLCVKDFNHGLPCNVNNMARDTI